MNVFFSNKAKQINDIVTIYEKNYIYGTRKENHTM